MNPFSCDLENGNSPGSHQLPKNPPALGNFLVLPQKWLLVSDSSCKHPYRDLPTDDDIQLRQVDLPRKGAKNDAIVGAAPKPGLLGNFRLSLGQKGTA